MPPNSQPTIITAPVFLLSTFSVFHPEKIVTHTSSRLLLTSTDAIFTRLYSQRSSSPSGSDSLLKHRFTSRSGRLLYSLCGPGLLSNCVWCHVDVPEAFLFYGLPNILFPHLVHIAILGLVLPNKYSGVITRPAQFGGLRSLSWGLHSPSQRYTVFDRVTGHDGVTGQNRIGVQTCLDLIQII